ncbi:MAG: hypothetical protein E7613_09450 [Ruminococcaceae bacterium]|nr:hypothetical protein [Oscillospiraceae bacterium]
MRRASEILKSIILVILAVSMLVLWTGYIYLQFDTTNESKATLQRSFWAFTDSTKAPLEITPDSSFLSPRSVSIMLSGKGYSSSYNSELTKTLYDSVAPVILEIFSSSYKCMQVEASEWNKALKEDNSILVEYSSQLPYTTIAQFLQKDENYCEGELCYVEKILLFSKESNTPVAVAVNQKGEVFSFTKISDDTSFVYDFNSNNLAAYTVNKGFIPFEFNQKTNTERHFPHLPPEYKLLEGAPNLSSVTVSNYLSDVLKKIFEEKNSTYLELVDDSALANVLDCFEINPHIAGFYSDTGTGLMFVGDNTRLTISPDGVINYSLIDGETTSIKTSAILRTARTSFASDELLAAATAFISDFSPSLIGGDASIVLKGIQYNSLSAEFTFLFGYQFNSLDIVHSDGSISISLVFNSEGITEAHIIPMNVNKTESDKNTSGEYLSADIVPSVIAPISDTSSNLEPIYIFEEYDETITPYWASEGINELK